MVALRRHIGATRYGDLYRSTILAPGERGPFPGDVAAARGRVAAAGSGETLLRLLGLGEAVAADALDAEARALIALLERAGLGGPVPGNLWRTDGWVAVPFGAGHLLADCPRAYGGQEVRVYLGPDSILLTAALPKVPGLRVLDMGAGCGVQGLLGVPEPAESVLVDIEPRAVRFCALNAELCGLGPRVRAVLGDLYEPVTGERFDLIACVPPYVPVPRGVPYSGVANGGPDGLGMLRRLLGGAGDHLRPGGRLVAVCQLLAGADGPLLAREAAALAPGLRLTAEVFSRVPAAQLTAELSAGLASRVPGWTGAMLAEAYGAAFRDLGATDVLGTVLRAERPA